LPSCSTSSSSSSPTDPPSKSNHPGVDLPLRQPRRRSSLPSRSDVALLDPYCQAKGVFPFLGIATTWWSWGSARGRGWVHPGGSPRPGQKFGGNTPWPETSPGRAPRTGVIGSRKTFPAGAGHPKPGTENGKNGLRGPGAPTGPGWVAGRAAPVMPNHRSQSPMPESLMPGRGTTRRRSSSTPTCARRSPRSVRRRSERRDFRPLQGDELDA
jgi:hypothetical protein